MARRTPKSEAQFTATLRPLQRTCSRCGHPLWIAYNTRRKVVTLEGNVQLRVAISQCHTPTCARYHVRSHPEEEGRWALPHGEFGLDIIALIGFWRFREHRSVPEMHQRLQARGLVISERAVTHLLHRYEELVSLHITDRERIAARLQSLAEACEHFCHITENFAAGLFHCYDIKGLPRTNNDLEHCFGVARVHERRAMGRRGAIPGVVVRGSVRVMATVKSREQVFSVEELRPRDYQRWKDLRRQLHQREEARRQQWRFRKKPAAYLAGIEARLLQ